MGCIQKQKDWDNRAILHKRQSPNPRMRNTSPLPSSRSTLPPTFDLRPSRELLFALPSIIIRSWNQLLFGCSQCTMKHFASVRQAELAGKLPAAVPKMVMVGKHFLVAPVQYLIPRCIGYGTGTLGAVSSSSVYFAQQPVIRTVFSFQCASNRVDSLTEYVFACIIGASRDDEYKLSDWVFFIVWLEYCGTTGIVDYTNYDDMKYAIRKLDDSEFRNPFSRSYIRVKSYGSGRSMSRSRSRSYTRSRSRSLSRSRSPISSRSKSPSRSRSHSKSGRSKSPSRSRSRSVSSQSRSRSPPRSKSRLTVRAPEVRAIVGVAAHHDLVHLRKNLIGAHLRLPMAINTQIFSLHSSLLSGMGARIRSAHIVISNIYVDVNKQARRKLDTTAEYCLHSFCACGLHTRHLAFEICFPWIDGINFV
eukprot:Gb_21062 [translate_table: standard]